MVYDHGNIDEFIRNYRKTLKTPQYCFKETLFGWVLMINNRQPTNSPGVFKDKWQKATKKETEIFMKEFNINGKKAVAFDKIKEQNPEYFL